MKLAIGESSLNWSWMWDGSWMGGCCTRPGWLADFMFERVRVRSRSVECDSILLGSNVCDIPCLRRDKSDTSQLCVNETTACCFQTLCKLSGRQVGLSGSRIGVFAPSLNSAVGQGLRPNISAVQSWNHLTAPQIQKHTDPTRIALSHNIRRKTEDLPNQRGCSLRAATPDLVERVAALREGASEDQT